MPEKKTNVLAIFDIHGFILDQSITIDTVKCRISKWKSLKHVDHYICLLKPIMFCKIRFLQILFAFFAFEIQVEVKNSISDTSKETLVKWREFDKQAQKDTRQRVCFLNRNGLYYRLLFNISPPSIRGGSKDWFEKHFFRRGSNFKNYQ